MKNDGREVTSGGAYGRKRQVGGGPASLPREGAAICRCGRLPDGDRMADRVGSPRATKNSQGTATASTRRSPAAPPPVEQLRTSWFAKLCISVRSAWSAGGCAPVQSRLRATLLVWAKRVNAASRSGAMPRGCGGVPLCMALPWMRATSRIVSTGGKTVCEIACIRRDLENPAERGDTRRRGALGQGTGPRACRAAGGWDRAAICRQPRRRGRQEIAGDSIAGARVASRHSCRPTMPKTDAGSPSCRGANRPASGRQAAGGKR